MKNAFVLRARGINHAGAHHPKGSVILDMSDGQFADWQGAEIVREATSTEVAAARRARAEQPVAAPTMARTTL